MGPLYTVISYDAFVGGTPGSVGFSGTESENPSSFSVASAAKKLDFQAVIKVAASAVNPGRLR